MKYLIQSETIEDCKYLVMTEGTCEKALIDVFIEKNLFSSPRGNLLYEEIFHARQINQEIIQKINILPFEEKIIIIRLGDKLSDVLSIPDEIQFRIKDIKKICIKPEFEILHLINMKLDDDYNKKEKKKKLPSQFLVEKDHAYIKTYDYNYEYFNKMKDEDLKQLIYNYSIKRHKTHKKDEGVLESYIIK